MPGAKWTPMNRDYRFILLVEHPENHTIYRSALNVDAYCAPFLRPYDLCDRDFDAAMTGGVVKLGAARIDADRKKLAEEIAGQLTEKILESMKSQDTRNGYKQEAKG